MFRWLCDYRRAHAQKTLHDEQVVAISELILRRVPQCSYLCTVKCLVDWRNELGGQDMSVFETGRGDCEYDPGLVSCANWMATQLAAGQVDLKEACRRLLRGTDLAQGGYLKWSRTGVLSTPRLENEHGVQLRPKENDELNRYVGLQLTEAQRDRKQIFRAAREFAEAERARRKARRKPEEASGGAYSRGLIGAC
jgi:hypothetical protein